MASTPQDSMPLVELGPFQGLDSTTNPMYVPPGKATAMTNANTWRVLGALSNEEGRANNVVFTFLPTYTISAIAAYQQDGLLQAALIDFSAFGTGDLIMFYVPNSGAQSTLTNSEPFTQAVQFNGILYTNGGQKFTTLDPTQMLTWQYPAPLLTPTVAGTAGVGLAAGTYAYAFTYVIHDPSGQIRQETSPDGIYPVNGAFPFQVTLMSPGDIIITPGAGQSWSGTMSDGSSYNTLMYRISSNQAQWFAVVNLTGSGPYTDGASDSFISSHEILDFHHDPPPATSINHGIVFSHKERVFWFGLALPQTIPNEAPPSVPLQVQCQLWASDYGVPWSFNSDPSAGQVMLVGDDATAANASYATLNDSPQAGISLTSLALLFKARTLWALYGDDPASFIVRKIADLGCAAGQSVAQYNGIVYWLSEDGIYQTDGWSQPQYISEPIRATLEAIPIADRRNAVSFIANRSYYISFPATGITLSYYIPAGGWLQTNMATNAVIYTPANGSEDRNGSQFNEVLAARQDGHGPALDWWFAGGANDLGLPMTTTWTSPLTDSGEMSVEKVYRFVNILAPYQPGMLTWTLTVDPGSPSPKVATGTFDLSAAPLQPQTRHNTSINLSPELGTGEELRGFMAQLELSFTTVLGQTANTVIYKAGIFGSYDRQNATPI